MSNAALGLTMLGLIVVVILLGFPTAFTLMGLGMFFGFIAFYNPAAHWLDNQVFDLMVQRAFGAMTNETLLSIPLFVLMGYVMERGALVDKMFHSVQLAFRRVPASLAVTTLIVCTFWGIASGLVGAVVVLMGVIAFRPMLKAGYDTRLAAGVITAGGTLGILIPPSVMIIVYAAVAGQSVVKLYAAAMFPGFFLSLLYLAYILGWALLNPKVAPKLPPGQMSVPISPFVAWLRDHQSRFMLPALLRALLLPSRAAAPAEAQVGFGMLLANLVRALVPLLLALVCLGTVWWYVTIYSLKDNVPQAAPAAVSAVAATPAAAGVQEPPGAGGGLQEPPGADSGGLQEPPGSEAPARSGGGDEGGLQQLGTDIRPDQHITLVPDGFYSGFAAVCVATLLLLAYYYRNLDAEQFEILRMLITSVMPLTVLTLVVLGVILFGITTATESAAVGAAGAFLMAWQARTLTFQRIKEAVFLTAKTTAMVCWLFVGSALFSAVFAILGGQSLVEQWIMAMNLTPVQFLLLSQAIIFILGWPLEWTEIIVIFVPIFLPLLSHFQIDPLLFGTLVFVNLQAAFLSPPVAMSAFYLKGVSPPHVTLNQIFAGMMPYMLIVIACMVIMYLWPGLTLWLPNYLYG
ncbi:TRAP transporter large permease [Piscinibacter sp.]|uniref:TRAP transporter large permease n=1 Tax=Piscinibacter sp. TaxID=1903157 RepID=UPI0039E3067D